MIGLILMILAVINVFRSSVVEVVQDIGSLCRVYGSFSKTRKKGYDNEGVVISLIDLQNGRGCL